MPRARSTAVAASPAAAAAANRSNFTINATDNESNLGYVLTAQVTAGAAASTVNNVNLSAIW